MKLYHVNHSLSLRTNTHIHTHNPSHIWRCSITFVCQSPSKVSDVSIMSVITPCLCVWLASNKVFKQMKGWLKTSVSHCASARSTQTTGAADSSLYLTTLADKRATQRGAGKQGERHQTSTTEKCLLARCLR